MAVLMSKPGTVREYSMMYGCSDIQAWNCQGEYENKRTAVPMTKPGTVRESMQSPYVMSALEVDYKQIKEVHVIRKVRIYVPTHVCCKFTLSACGMPSQELYNVCVAYYTKIDHQGAFSLFSSINLEP